jgi:biopolymer transport protein ExbD
MYRSSVFHSRHESMELKMTSLIDVVFLLLIFFVWTASFRLVEYVLPSKVSESREAERAGNAEQPPVPAADFADIVVRISWSNGQPGWRVNDEPAANLAEVQEKLSRVFSIHAEAPVILHPDPEVPLGHVIDLYDLTRRIGFSQVQFAASQED